MIEPTAEMRRAAYDALPPEVRLEPAELDEVVAAVLAILERDYCPEQRGHVFHPLAKNRPGGAP